MLPFDAPDKEYFNTLPPQIPPRYCQDCSGRSARKVSPPSTKSAGTPSPYTDVACTSSSCPRLFLSARPWHKRHIPSNSCSPHPSRYFAALCPSLQSPCLPVACSKKPMCASFLRTLCTRLFDQPPMTQKSAMVGRVFFKTWYVTALAICHCAIVSRCIVSRTHLHA